MKKKIEQILEQLYNSKQVKDIETKLGQELPRPTVKESSFNPTGNKEIHTYHVYTSDSKVNHIVGLLDYKPEYTEEFILKDIEDEIKRRLQFIDSYLPYLDLIKKHSQQDLLIKHLTDDFKEPYNSNTKSFDNLVIDALCLGWYPPLTTKLTEESEIQPQFFIESNTIYMGINLIKPYELDLIGPDNNTYPISKETFDFIDKTLSAKTFDFKL